MTRLSAAALAAALLAGEGASAAPPVIRVDTVRTSEDCSLLDVWGFWLVAECRDQFPGMRTSLQSALLESDRIRLSTREGGRDAIRPALSVSASVTGLGSSLNRATGSGYCAAGTRVKATMDYRVRNAASGAVLYGGSVTKSVEVAHHVVSGSEHCATSAPSRDEYRLLQTELALATARAIVFQLQPLQVISAGPDGVMLNYGAPFLKLGSAVDINGADGLPMRARVVNAGSGSALARPVAGYRPVPAGASARFIEDDDEAANARRFERVELP